MCLRRRLGLPDRDEEGRNMAVGLEHQGESYGLLVDQVGEVMKLSADTHEPSPVHMDPRWVKLSRGVHRLDDKLLIILDVDAVLSLEVQSQAA
jgi:purine-binding chemotaxis protein CheW